METNETKLIAITPGEIPLDVAKHAALCTAVAKQQHEAWVAARIEHGWRSGTKFDQRAKTHPLIRLWDQLPAQFQIPNLNPLHKLLKRVNDDGYDVVQPDDWKRHLRKLRKGSPGHPLELD